MNLFVEKNTIQDSLSLYLRAGEPLARPNVLQVDFGRFEYLPLENNQLFFAIDSTAARGMQFALQGNAGSGMPYAWWMESAVFLLFMLCFVCFALVFRTTRSTFHDNFKNKLSTRKNSVPGHKVQVTTAEVWGEFFMIGQTILVTTILIFVYFQARGHIVASPQSYLAGFIGLFFGLSLLTGLKFLMYKAVSVFFIPMDLARWIGQYYRHLQLLGIFLFLPALVFVFLQEYRNILFVVVLFLFFINRLLIIISLLNIFVKNKIGLLYFFVYLCGTEIAPYLLFYKGALSIVNIAGNYLV